MNFVKILLVQILLLSNCFIFAQTSIVFEEHFENNIHRWKLHNSPTDQAEIKAGKLAWQHFGVMGNTINNYFNQLNTQMDYSVEAKFDVRKIGGEYGLMFGGIDQENALFFTVKNMQYR